MLSARPVRYGTTVGATSAAYRRSSRLVTGRSFFMRAGKRTLSRLVTFRPRSKTSHWPALEDSPLPAARRQLVEGRELVVRGRVPAQPLGGLSRRSVGVPASVRVG